MSSRNLSFRHSLDVPLPEELFVGRGAVVHLRGWCYSPEARMKRLEIVAGGVVAPVPNHSWARADVFAEHCPASDLSGNSLLSGFEAFLPILPNEADQDIELLLRATLRGGEIVERPLGRVMLRAGYGAVPATVVWPKPDSPRVAICMTTFNPPRTLLARQIASLQAQTHQNWVCIIADDHTDHEGFEYIRFLVKGDSRFVLYQNPQRRNFYRNFEEVLRRTPADADIVALCDQDDIWQPDKLATLVATLGDGGTLAYSDARVLLPRERPERK
jgi:hypothetical protein